MNYQARSFQISILLHGLIIFLVIFGSTFMKTNNKVIAISFDLYNPVSKTEDSPLQAASPLLRTKPVAAAIIKKSGRKELPVPPEKKPQVLPVSEIPPAVELPVANKLDTQTMAIGKSDTSATVRDGYSAATTEQNERSNTTGIAYTAGAGKAAKIKYLNDHFAYIRDKILRNVSYPDAARRMGWQGKVVLSFIITAKGYVRDFSVIQSSGFKVLDNKAIETVKETAPFPKPPDEAYIVIPITYRLQ